MPNYENIFWNMLDKYGGQKLREGKHLVYALPNGNKLTVGKTPSDNRAWANMIRDLRRAMGLKREPKKPTEVKPKERRVRPRHDEEFRFTIEPIRQSENVMAQLDFAAKLGLAATKLIPQDEESPEYKPNLRKSRVTPTERHGQVKQLPPEVIKKANQLAILDGEEAARNYIEMHLQIDRVPKQLKKEDESEDSKEEYTLELAQVVESAKAKKEVLLNDIKTAEQRIAEANREIQTKQELIKKADEFINQMELSMVAFSEVEALFASEKVKAKEGNGRRKVKVGTSGKSREGVPSMPLVLDKIHQLLMSDANRQFNYDDMLTYVRQQGGEFEKTDKKAIYYATNYALKSNKHTWLKKVGTGTFAYSAPAPVESSLPNAAA